MSVHINYHPEKLPRMEADASTFLIWQVHINYHPEKLPRMEDAFEKW